MMESCIWIRERRDLLLNCSAPPSFRRGRAWTYPPQVPLSLAQIRLRLHLLLGLVVHRPGTTVVSYAAIGRSAGGYGGSCDVVV